ncbi:MAG: NADP-dependent phosphogluconate dehydrogenase [Acidobacteriota bacterium]|nr:MAG: NADP-dependent phosphogluconate dehydrogenase [Acidobacteriota bacterium]
MTSQFGMIGLGTMGRNFLLNVTEHGFSAVGFDIDAAKRDLLLSEGVGLPVDTAPDLAEFVSKLAAPRSIMLLVPAGPIVDSVIAELTPLIAEGDLIIDGGNSHYTDTDRRMAYLAAKGIGFLGVGVSGGEEGARRGPSIMPGGPRDYYDRVEPVFQAVAAKVNGEPCVAYMGSGSAGHFVKMVHNGIEYGMMQLIAETHDYMRRALHMQNTELHRTFGEWNSGELSSFLIEITSIVLKKIDAETGRPLVELILDTAGQKGTGKWTSQAAMDLGVPVPTIDCAVTLRQISSRKQLRQQISAKYDDIHATADLSRSRTSINELKDGLYAAIVLTYIQGMSMLQAASVERGYGLDLAEIAKIWRGGCIIRSKLLETIREAYAANPAIETLLLDDRFSRILLSRSRSLRKAVISFNENAIPSACMSSALAYFDAFRSANLPANLIQAQRDYFGAHTYQRIDQEGIFHTDDWE